MKARKIIGGVIAIIGLMATVSVADNSSYEMAVRIGGTAMFAAGAWIGKYFDFQNSNQ